MYIINQDVSVVSFSYLYIVKNLIQWLYGMNPHNSDRQQLSYPQSVTVYEQVGLEIDSRTCATCSTFCFYVDKDTFVVIFAIKLLLNLPAIEIILIASK